MSFQNNTIIQCKLCFVFFFCISLAIFLNGCATYNFAGRAYSTPEEALSHNQQNIAVALDTVIENKKPTELRLAISLPSKKHIEEFAITKWGQPHKTIIDYVASSMRLSYQSYATAVMKSNLFGHVEVVLEDSGLEDIQKGKYDYFLRIYHLSPDDGKIELTNIVANKTLSVRPLYPNFPGYKIFYAALNEKIEKAIREDATGVSPVYGNEDKKSRISQGSGFLLSETGYVVTNYHVVEGHDKIAVFYPEANRTFAAFVFVKDTNNDLVILKLKDFSYGEIFLDEIPYCIGNSSDVVLAESVFTLGFPYGEALGKSAKFSIGAISSLRGLIGNASLFQISNPIQPGSSGGPLFNKNGDLVGIVVASLDAAIVFKYTGSIPQNVNFAIKSDYLKILINELPERKEIFERKGTLESKEVQDQVTKLLPFIVSIDAQ